MNIKLICRLCLRKCDILVDVFSGDLVEKIKNVLDLEINHKGSLSTLICNECTDKIEDIHQYKGIVVQNQKLLLESNCAIPSDEGTCDGTKYLVEITHESTVDLNDHNQSNQEFIKLNEFDSILDNDNDIYSLRNDNDIFLSTNVPNIDDITDAGDEPKEAEFTDVAEDNENTFVDDSELPEHLTKRMTKLKSDQQIKEFVVLSCDLCEDKQPFDTFKILMDHFKNVHKVPGYVVCCDKKIPRKDRLLNHITNHINPDAFKCPKCGQNSKSKVLLKIHMKQHLPVDERQFQCKTCSQRFVLKSQLTNHEATHYSQEQKKYVCDECGKAFALKFVLIKHKMTHSKEKNFVCEVCAKTFYSKANLDAHSKLNHHIQKSQQRMQCNCCCQWYKNLETLKTHMRQHREKAKFYCSTCGKEAATKSALAAHIRYVHLKIKEFECSVCNKQFRRKLELTEHMARHTNQILYSCPFCTKTFKSSSNYFSHRKNQHPHEFATITSKSKTE